MLNEKLLKRAAILSALVSFVLLILYYFMFYIPLTREVESLFGYPNILELLLVYILIVAFSLPISCGIFIVSDYNTGDIYPKKWMTVTLIKKHKEYYSYISPRGGSGSGKYRYRFDFQDEEDNLCSFHGSTKEYECLIEGAKVQIQVNGPMIVDISLVEENI